MRTKPKQRTWNWELPNQSSLKYATYIILSLPHIYICMSTIKCSRLKFFFCQSTKPSSISMSILNHFQKYCKMLSNPKHFSVLYTQYTQYNSGYIHKIYLNIMLPFCMYKIKLLHVLLYSEMKINVPKKRNNKDIYSKLLENFEWNLLFSLIYFFKAVYMH